MFSSGRCRLRMPESALSRLLYSTCDAVVVVVVAKVGSKSSTLSSCAVSAPRAAGDIELVVALLPSPLPFPLRTGRRQRERAPVGSFGARRPTTPVMPPKCVLKTHAQLPTAARRSAMVHCFYCCSDSPSVDSSSTFLPFPHILPYTKEVPVYVVVVPTTTISHGKHCRCRSDEQHRHRQIR